jgi:hypothetical protein
MSWLTFKHKDHFIREVPYESLFTPGEFASRDAFSELHCRMRRMIFYMARSSGATVREAVAAVSKVFLELAPEFPGKPPALGLRRLARIVKRTIGEEAFEPFYFYAQAAIYYMDDPLEREMLSRFYELGANISEARLAAEFGLSGEAEASRVLKAAVSSFRLAQQQLPVEELRLMTNGHFPL